MINERVFPIHKQERNIVRYNDDIINAEKWNTGLKNSLAQKNPGADNITVNQKRSMPKSVNRKRASITSINSITESHTPSGNTLKSKQRTRGRKKRDKFLLSWLLTGLLSRDRK